MISLHMTVKQQPRTEAIDGQCDVSPNLRSLLPKVDRDALASHRTYADCLPDPQDALAHDCPACASTRTGTVKQNVDPLPGSDSTQIRPPCISMMRLAIDRPRPVPPFLRVIELSACWNSSKIFA